MTLSKKLLSVAQKCETAEDLVKQSAEAGERLSIGQAQKIIDSVSMVELEDDDVAIVSGGRCGEQNHIDNDPRIASITIKAKNSVDSDPRMAAYFEFVN